MKVINRIRKPIAIIGMPRSGSTIVASYINSLEGAFILGEPFLAANAPRPAGRNWPVIVDTKFDDKLHMHPGSHVFDVLIDFGNRHNISILGFKECWTPWTDAINIVTNLGSELEMVLVTIRDPRKNYMSIIERTPAGSPPLYASVFNREYIRFCNLVKSLAASPVFLDAFREDPKLEIEAATGWQLAGEHTFDTFSGGGDEYARTATRVRPRDTRASYNGRDITQSIEAYESLLKV